MDPDPDNSPWNFSIDVSAAGAADPRQRTLPRAPVSDQAKALLEAALPLLNQGADAVSGRAAFFGALGRAALSGEYDRIWKEGIARGAAAAALPTGVYVETLQETADRFGRIALAMNPSLDLLDLRLLRTRSAQGLPQLTLTSIVSRHLFSDGAQLCPVFQLTCDSPEIFAGRLGAFDVYLRSAHVNYDAFREHAHRRFSGPGIAPGSAAEDRLLEHLLYDAMLEEGCHGVDWTRIADACGYEFDREPGSHYREIRDRLVRPDGQLAALYRDPAQFSKNEQDVLAHAGMELSAALLIGAFGRPAAIARRWQGQLARLAAEVAPARAIDFSNHRVCYGMVAAIATSLCAEQLGLWCPVNPWISDPTAVELIHGTTQNLEGEALRNPQRMQEIFETVRRRTLQVPPVAAYSLHPAQPARP